jgi:hypothetical protein
VTEVEMTSHRNSTRRAVRIGLSAALLAIMPLAGSLRAAERVEAAASPDRLPDLSMSMPTDIVIQTTSAGVRRLQFTTTIVNIGSGPFETRASRRSTSVPTMLVSQRIYNAAGGTRVHDTSAIARYAGDGHDHWHVQGVAGYALFAPTGKGPSLRRDAKVGFCFFDTNPYRLSLPGAPSSRVYQQSGCGTRSSLFVKNGISVGWSDRYPWNFAWQWIDITNLPGGEYLLKVTADPNGNFVEEREKNNCNWTRIRFSGSGSSLTILESGWGCALPGSDEPPPVGRVVIPPRDGS